MPPPRRTRSSSRWSATTSWS
uniref:Ccp1 n=1 Tax=Arundo donax TaxID=35708 RepID=A0A0A9HFP0_ARUDO